MATKECGSPKLEELPKLPGEVKTEMFGVHLRHAEEPKEKVVLPTAHDIAQEKTIAGIETFEKKRLSHVTTEEKTVLPSKEDVAREKSTVEAAQFDHNKLRHTSTEEKHEAVVIDDKKA